jgi:endonuclease I
MIKRVSLFSALLISATSLFANIDMQAHVGTDEARQAYDQYVERQAMYYEDDCAYYYLRLLTGDELFGRLNSLMGSTCKLGTGYYSYNSLRDAYVGVDRDLNKPGNIIGYYDGRSMNGTWDSGKTYNREHTWPQSKGANKGIPMGHDMQSVRPTNASINSSRGNTAYGESGSYYDPNEIAINNAYYRSENLGSYRGDAARVILYDYIVYGEAGGYKNKLYNTNAQLLNKLGASGVFESIPVLIKWHMQDPPSLTEMVRNDGAQDYQGNRNPMIDYPELALQIFLNHSSVSTYNVTVESSATMWPAHQYTLSDGFIAYLTHTDGSHPTEVSVSGAQYTYDPQLGRLTITKVTAAVTISTSTSSVENITYNSSATIYTLSGTVIAQCTADELNASLQTLVPGTYIIKQGATITKVLL